MPWHRRAFLDPAALRYWLAVAAVAVALTAGVHRTLADAEALRARWGPSTEVLVTTTAARTGDRLAPIAEQVRWPRSLAPAETLDVLDAGDRAATDLDPGTPLTEALVRDGDRARATERHLVIEAPSPGLESGDRVDVWATGDPTLAPTADESPRLVAEAAQVVQTGDGQVVLAVRTDEVRALARARSLADLTLAVVP